MIYHVEIVGFLSDRTDMTTRSFYESAYRRRQLERRGYIAQVKTGSGRLVIDALGQERR